MGVADQTLFAGANFLTHVLLARWLPAEAYGLFALVYAIFLFIGGFHNALAIEPMIVFGAGRYRRRFPGYLRGVLVLHSQFCALTAVVLAVVAAAVYAYGERTLAATLAALALAAPLALLLWLLRRACYARLQLRLAVGLSGLYLVVQVLILAALHEWGLLDVPRAVLSLGGASLIASLAAVGLFTGGRSTRRRPGEIGRLWRRHWRYGKWIFGTASLQWLTQNVFYLVLPISHGLVAVSVFRAMVNLTLPIRQVLMPLMTLLIPTLARRRGASDFLRIQWLVILALMPGALAFWAVLWVFRQPVVQFVYGDGFSEAADLLLWLGLIPVMVAVGSVWRAGLKAEERPDLMFPGFVWSAAVSLLLGVPFTMMWGATGATWGLVLATLAATVANGVQVHRARRGRVRPDDLPLSSGQFHGTALLEHAPGVRLSAAQDALGSTIGLPSAPSGVTGQSQVVANLLAVLRQRGVTPCVLRNYETLPDPAGHDIDALVAAPQRGAVLDALRRDLPGAGLRLVQLHARRGLVQLAVADAALSPASLVHVDLFTRAGQWRGVEYLPSAEVLAAARPHGEAGHFLVPRPAHEACLSLLYPLLNAGRTKRAYLARCAALAEADRETFEHVLTRGFGSEVAAEVARRLAAQDADALDALRPRLRAALIRRAAGRAPVRTALGVAGFAIDKAASVWTRDRLAVAFIGPDGVGKTTVMRGVAGTLRRSFPGGVAYGHWRPSVARPLHREVLTGSAGRRPVGLAEDRGGVERAVSVARLVASAGLFIVGYAARVWPAKLRRKLVLLDRYAYGYVLEPAAVKYYGPPALAWAVLRLIPRPDVTILLTAPPATIRARKDELSEAQIESQIERGREAARRLSRVVEVDASGDAAATVDRVATAVMRVLAKRTARRGGGQRVRRVVRASDVGRAADPHGLLRASKASAKREGDARLRVLITAYTASPGVGSEAALGWHWPRQAARRHDVWLITRPKYRAAIEAALPGEPDGERLRVTYVDGPRWCRWWKRGLLLRWVYFYLWQFWAYRAAERLHAEVDFDLAHHVTLGVWRLPPQTWRLGVPLVWGPIGGGQETPAGLWPELGRRGMAVEAARWVGQRLSFANPQVRAAHRHASAVLATDRQTQRWLARLPGAGPTPVVFPGIGVESVPDVPHARSASAGVDVNEFGNNALRLLWVSRLLPYKALPLLLRALARVGDRIEFRLLAVDVGEHARERRRCQRLIERLGLAERVTLQGPGPYEEARGRYERADVFVFTSLRESSGTVLLEAMSAGLPTVCLNHGGPGVIATPETAVMVEPGPREAVINALAEAIVRLGRDPELRRRMGEAARRRVAETLTWDRHGDRMETVYREVVRERNTAVRKF